MRRIRVPRVPPRVFDAAMALGFFAASVLLGREPPPTQGWRALDAFGYLLTALVNLPIAVRGRAPVAGSVLVSVAWAWFVHAGFWPVVNSLAPLLLVYTVAATRSRRSAVGCALLMSTVWLYAGLTAAQGSMATVVVQAVVSCLVICRLGFAARLSAQRADQLAAMAEELRREQERRAEQAVAEERRRIARELHDVVAHHMSVVSVQAGMARFVLPSDPATAGGALQTIADTTHEALQEMRRMLKVLRADGDVSEDPAAYDPMPSVARLEEVVERIRAAGVPTELRITGEPRPLNPGAALCAYRIVQEALTNVLKHAGPAGAAVEVDYQPQRLVVSVTDDGGGGAFPAAGRPGGGHGLIGMRERARLYGGTVATGPLPDGGFGVRLTLPLTAPDET